MLHLVNVCETEIIRLVIVSTFVHIDDAASGMHAADILGYHKENTTC